MSHMTPGPTLLQDRSTPLERFGIDGRARVSWWIPAALFLVGLLLGGMSCGDAAGASAHQLPAEIQTAAGTALPNTDGAAREEESARPDPAERLRQLRAAQRACEGPCIAPFGSRLGAASGVEARSNCVSTCLRLEYSFVDPESGELRIAKESPDPERLEYAGVTYQCVEYARRWWIRRLGMTFGDVPTAADIFDLEEGLRLSGHAPVPLGRSLNGSARRAPRRGDLVVYAKDPGDPEWRFGHVAVVVDVDTDQGWVALAEENYDNRPWRDPDAYARRIRLFAVGGRYTLVDLEPGRTRNADGGRIAGWVYPVAAP